MSGFSSLFKRWRNSLDSFADEPELGFNLNPLVQIYYFGSFNPVHVGHLKVAQEALATLASQGFEEVVFVPSPNPPNKMRALLNRQYPMMPLNMRLRLLQHAIDDMGAGNSLKVLALEKEQDDAQKPTYTAETLQYYFADFLRDAPEQKLFLLMGEETLETLPEWEQAPWLMQHVHCVVMPRPSHQSLYKSIKTHVLMEERYGLSLTCLKPEHTFPMNATSLRSNKACHESWLTPSVAQRLS
ncbi:MAG: nicotinate-nicotinamide nucleotide adenylyltransferase [Vampirovibrionales bacterium]